MQERFQAFTRIVASVSRSIYRIKSEAMSQFGLKSSHVSCIYYIYRAESITASCLCDMCEEDKANISRSLRYLEENGYVVRDNPYSSRHRGRLSLSEKGRYIGKFLSEQVDRVIGIASEGVDDQERGIMYTALGKISKNLESICLDVQCAIE